MFDRHRLEVLVEAIDDAIKPADKGTSLEVLCQYVLGQLEGVEVRDTRVRTPHEEIDILLWNAGVEPVLRQWDDVILVECKNWSTPASSNELESFVAKLRRRGCQTGIFIAANGVTGGYLRGDGREVGAAAVIREALGQGIRVPTLTLDDLRELHSTEDLCELLKERTVRLYVHRAF